MNEARIQIELLPALEEGGPERVDVWRIEEALKQADSKPQKLVLMRKSLGHESVELGEFLVRYVGPAGIAAVSAWLVAKAGRKVRLKIGDVEAEASKPEEIDRLLRSAKQFREDETPPSNP